MKESPSIQQDIQSMYFLHSRELVICEATTSISNQSNSFALINEEKIGVFDTFER